MVKEFFLVLFFQAPANTYMQYMIAPQGWPTQAPAMDPGIVSIEAICMAYRQRRAASQQVELSRHDTPQSSMVCSAAVMIKTSLYCYK